jgi:hypothetical protein
MQVTDNLAMAQGTSKYDLERMACAKFDDAALLFDNSRWANAFYIAGYSVELALKAAVAKQFLAETIPDRRFVNSIHTHEFSKLIGLAGLTGELRAKQDKDSSFSANWGIAAEWTPESRYESVDKSTAHFLLHAISEPDHGVLQWIKTYW